MQQFTRTEVAWIISALKEVAERYQFEATEYKYNCGCTGYASETSLAPFLYLRSEQLFGIADRLQAILDNNDNKIRIL
ncbi:hypothetical protein [Flavonifractor sp. An82]|uniref:hypothetical protein n=1 Tax=Flavonifractor sp. An82 TaxID=1965660 RepID=UPI0011241F18|nr:hypothetical protein [Flavonifractor sp. An82]